MIFQLNLVGWLCIILALLHFIFPTYFNWSNELKLISLINRQLMYIHTLFIALVVFLIGLLCLTSATDLIETPLGHRIAFGLFTFWVLRLFVQFFGYSTRLWRGKPVETAIHFLFICLWAYFSTVFLMVSVPDRIICVGQ